MSKSLALCTPQHHGHLLNFESNYYFTQKSIKMLRGCDNFLNFELIHWIFELFQENIRFNIELTQKNESAAEVGYQL